MNGNLGVWDTLAAIRWTKKYISKFGGDPDNITAIGQSAGAGIITWLLLAEEGKIKLPFDQAWIASPGIPPRKNLERSRPLFNQILNHTKCSTVHCLRNISEKDMRDVNHYMLVEERSGSGGGSLGPGVGFTPTVDGELVSDLPATAFAAGKFNRGIKQIVVGNTALEVRFLLCCQSSTNVMTGTRAFVGQRYAQPLPRGSESHHSKLEQ